ncbi:hypothetical protein G210_3686 [Candida maltosa Xu316]|uniref:Uncharacterized protein n=1 Tax=Candida maltosa (strain Xu316) TaxID=1245528 RepID=M3J2L2_CANMX|nr:hypothetical protein G210_3686 [Candida maltosa Xu316]
MVISYLVSKVPFSNHIPIVRRFSSPQQAPSTPTSSDTEDDEYEEGEEIKPIVVESPKDKVHARLINNRGTNIASPINDGNIFDSPTRLNHLPTVDHSSTMSVSQRLARRKSKGKMQSDTSSSSSLKFKGPSLDPPCYEVDEVKEKDEDEEEAKNIRIKQYLHDQNNKFDQLITKNIDVVLHPELNQTPNERLVQMVIDNRRAIAGTLYSMGKAQISSRLPYIPFLNPKNKDTTTTKTTDTKEETEESESTESTPTLLGSPFTDYCQQIVEYEGNQPYIEEPDSPQKETERSRMIAEEQAHFDQLMTHLDDEIKVDIFIDTLDDKTKLMLYESLKHDLKDYRQQQENSLRDIYHASPLDKIQIFIIISVKLFITGIKLFVPITKYLIHKFQNNQLFIFNMKNVEKFIDLVLRFMNYLDSKLNNNEEVIDKIYQHDYVKTEENLEQLYQDLTSYTTDLFKPSNIKNLLISKDDHIKGNVYDYVVGNITRKDKSTYVEDPKNAKFYSNKSPIQERERYSATEFAISSSESSITSNRSSQSSLQNPSVLKAAEKFVNEM